MQYPFRRDFFYQVKDSLKEYPVCILIGPLRCGKTVCLKQLNEETEHAKYFDFKALSEDAALLALDEVLESIQRNTEKLFLLDDVSYVKNIETELWNMAHAIDKKTDVKTRIVLAGSQIYALETWVNRAFYEPVGIIRADFISYPEFARYKNVSDKSAETHDQYLKEAAKFHQIPSLKEYLTDCLKETVVSNANTSDYLLDNDCYLVEDHVEYFIQVLVNEREKERSYEIPIHPEAKKQTLNLLKNWGLIRSGTGHSLKHNP